MKTLVEFFDTNQIENVNALLRYKPDKVVFVGFKNVMSKSRKRAIDKFLSIRLGDDRPEIEYVCDITEYDLDGIVSRLDRITDENEDCYFDITGGKESVLIAAGIVAVSQLRYAEIVDAFVVHLHSQLLAALRGAQVKSLGLRNDEGIGTND